MMGQPVEHGAGEPFGTKGVGPFVERQVRGNDDGTTFIALADEFKEQFGTGL